MITFEVANQDNDNQFTGKRDNALTILVDVLASVVARFVGTASSICLLCDACYTPTLILEVGTALKNMDFFF